MPLSEAQEKVFWTNSVVKNVGIGIYDYFAVFFPCTTQMKHLFMRGFHHFLVDTKVGLSER